MHTELKDKISILPDSPGCYIYKNKLGKIIYVGKSKSLKKRVNSYFVGAHDLKTTLLVNEVYDLEYVVTHTEVEALLLELNLIKEHTPKYNIKLTDDKTYPYIQITKEKHPRLRVTRNPMVKNKYLFGPYPSAYSAHETVRLLNKMYPLRNCEKLPKKECIYYHIGQCIAPCIKEITEEDYQPIIQSITKFLQGDVKSELKTLKEKMYDASERLDFEAAKEFRDMIQHVEAIIEKQQIYLSDFVDRDIFGFHIEENKLSVSIFYMRGGKIITRDQDLVEFTEDQPMSQYLAQFYLNSNHPKPKEILVPFEDELLNELLEHKLFMPQRGKKKSLLDMATKNAVEQIDHLKQLLEKKLKRTVYASNDLAELLGLSSVSKIEAFDNSNLLGTDAVSGMVVFVDGKPNKKEYRKYRIKTVQGPDDYGTMREVIYRRYLKVLSENLEKPDLIIVDGGKGQVTSAVEVLDTLGLSIPVIGLKKDQSHTLEAVIKWDLSTLEVSKRSQVYHLLNAIQDEVHRYAITFHRQTKSKSTFTSVLDDIDGLGPERRRRLFQSFASVKEIKDTSVFDLVKIGIPEAVAIRILDRLKEMKL